jgi:caa(3)-type oxidase subunit IV
MADAHDPHAHHGPHIKAYFAVFGALSVCTAMSFVVNRFFPPPDHTGAAIIMGVAVVKAVLVGYIFMHLKWDWRNVYFIIFPLFILATMMVIVLMPDLVYAWRT